MLTFTGAARTLIVWLTGTPGIIVMPAENATADNTTVIPGVVSEQVLQQAIKRASGKAH